MSRNLYLRGVILDDADEAAIKLGDAALINRLPQQLIPVDRTTDTSIPETETEYDVNCKPRVMWFATVAEARAEPKLFEIASAVEIKDKGTFEASLTSTANDDGSEDTPAFRVTGVTSGAFVRVEKQTAQTELERMLSDITSAAPKSVLDIFVGENLPNDTTVDEWPGTWPIDLQLVHSGLGSKFAIKQDPITGIRYISSADSAARSLAFSGAIIKSVFVVYRQALASNATDCIVASFTSPNLCGLIDANADQFNVTAPYGTPVHYVDGARSESVPIDGQWHVIECEDPENTTITLNIGGYNTVSCSIIGDIAAVVPCLAVLTAAQRTNITNALMRYYGISKSRGVFVDGNSIAFGTPLQGVSYDWLHAIRAPNVNMWNIATAGHTLAQVLAGMTAGFASKSWSGMRDVVYFMYEDTNTITGGATAAAVLALNWQIAEAARALGMQVLLSTCLPCTSITGGPEAVRVAVNIAKRAECVSRGYHLVDLAAVPGLDVASDTRYFGDGTHLTAIGQHIMAAEVRKAIALI